MSFGRIPVKNPGRYLERFVSILQPKGGHQPLQGSPAVQFTQGGDYSVTEKGR